MDTKQLLANRRASVNQSTKERRKSKRLENLNLKRNIKIDENKNEVKKPKPKPRIDKELAAWRKKKELEKKNNINNKKPVFKNCIAVKHTGGTPFRDNFSLPFNRKPMAAVNKLVFNPKIHHKTTQDTQNDNITRRTLRSNFKDKENIIPVFTQHNYVTRRQKPEDKNVMVFKAKQTESKAGTSGVRNKEPNPLMTESKNIKVKFESKKDPLKKNDLKPAKAGVSKRIDKVQKEESTRTTRSMSRVPKKKIVIQERTEADEQKCKLKNETSRLLLLVVEWEDKKKLLTDQDIVDEIDSVIGLTRLLIRSKFKQFESLIDEFDKPGNTKILVDDLNGFWDMMFLQVVQLDSKFKNLEKLTVNN